MVIYPCTFLFVLPQKEKIPKEKSQALNLRGYSEHVFAKRQETRFAQFTPLRLGAAMRRWATGLPA